MKGNEIMYEKQIKKISGFEKTPNKLKKVKDVNRIFEIANIKMPINLEVENYWKNGKNLKKLLDDRRQLTGLCLAMFRILFLSHQDIISIFENDCIRILQKTTGKTIDELIDYE